MPGPWRSKGCYRCRERKVKCDEEHPACKRCRASRVKCPGYRPEKEIRFCSMNNIIAGERTLGGLPSKERRVSREGEVEALQAGKNEGRTEDEKGHDEPSWVLSRRPELRSRLSFDWLNAATCRFYADYVIESENLQSGPGFMCKLPSLAARVAIQERDSVLQHAVSALALVYFSKQVCSSDLEVQSRKQYGKGIAELRRNLMRGNFTGDGVIAGTVLLNCYELFSGDRPLQRSIWETHGDAMGLLLRMRGTSDQFLSEDVGSICRIAHCIVIFKKLLSREPPDYESTLWEQSLLGCPPTSCDQALLACIRIARLLPIADAAFVEDRSDQSGSDRLLDIINAIQQETNSHIPLSTQITVTEPTGSTSELSEPARWLEDRYRSVYCAARIISLQTLLDLAVRAEHHTCLSHFAANMKDIRMRAAEDLHATVDEIISSTAMVLTQSQGEDWHVRAAQDGKAVAGHTSVWPLAVALGIRSISLEQRRLLSGQLDTIERTLGIKLQDVVWSPEHAYSREPSGLSA